MVTIDDGRCDRCGTCIAVCRADALCLTDRLSAQLDRCVSCGLCVRVCPLGALALDESGLRAKAPARPGG